MLAEVAPGTAESIAALHATALAEARIRAVRNSNG
jgi:hypothetical protein